MRVKVARSRITALIAALAVVGAVLVASTAIGHTQAAWTDQASAQADVDSGMWQTGNSCTAVNSSGKSVTCTVGSFTFTKTGTVGNQTRTYRLSFSATNAKTINFSVDLTKATGTQSTWSWTNAGLASSAQLTPAGGWTCDWFPRVTGIATSTTITFAVYENQSGKSVVCS